MSIIQYLHWKRDHDYKQINVDSQILYNDWEIIISNVFVFWEHNILEASELKHIFGFTGTHIHMHIYQIFLCFSILKKGHCYWYWFLTHKLVIVITNVELYNHSPFTKYKMVLPWHLSGKFLSAFQVFFYCCCFHVLFFFVCSKKKNDYLLYFLFLSFEIMIGFFLVSLQFLFSQIFISSSKCEYFQKLFS